MTAITLRVTSDTTAGTGTITTSTSSPTVTGSGTSFTTQVVIGQILKNSGGTTIGTVLSVDSSTQITLTSNAAVAVSGGAYNIVSTGITTKNSPLTNAEIDQNFVNINNTLVSNAVPSVSNVPNTVVKRGPSGEFSAGVATLAAGTNVGGTTVPSSNVTQAQMEAGTDTTTRFMTAQNVKQAIDMIAPQDIGAVTKDITGFESIAGSTLSYNDATRVFTLGTSSSYNVWYRGTKTTINTTKTVTLAATAGVHYVYLNSGTMALEETTVEATAWDSHILVAYVYLDTATTKGIIVGDERHSSSRDTDWHKSQHNNVGAIWRSGGSLSYTLNNPAAVTLSFTSPIYLADEDLVHTISHNATPSGYLQQVLTGTASLPTIYLNGTTYSEANISTVPWVAGTATARINTVLAGVGSLTDAGEGKYLNYWIVATNDIVRPIKAIMGRVAYSTQSDCYNERFVDYGIPFLEMAPMYQVTLLTQGALANKVQIVNVRTIYNSQGGLGAGFEVPLHSQLASLGTDDHAQYVHISNARTITAAHTFSGNNTFQGTQGFNNVTVAGVTSHMIPTAASTYDLGSTTSAWRHVYTSDLHLSNEKHESGNIVDGTRGNWTVQEGEEVLYIINNKNGKRYKFSLEEV